MSEVINFVAPRTEHVKGKILQIKEIESEGSPLLIVGLELSDGRVMLTRANEVIVEDLSIGQTGIFVISETIAGKTGYMDEFGNFIAHKRNAHVITSAMAIGTQRVKSELPVDNKPADNHD